MSLFVTLEGIDGSGKSTQALMLADQVRAAGHEPILTREPGGAPGAEDIRKLLVEGEPGRWTAETELLLFTAARLDHVQRTIRPALDASKVVICDRYLDSTRVYQGGSRLRDMVDQLHGMTIGLMPDLTLIFDLDPETAFSRADARGDHENRFEKKGLAFQRDLREGFLGIAHAEPQRCHVIDAAGDPITIAQDVWTAVSERLG